MKYLDKWEEGVDKCQGFTKAEKEKMILTRETRTGLRITGTINVYMNNNYVCIVIIHEFFYSVVFRRDGPLYLHNSRSNIIPEQ